MDEIMDRVNAMPRYWHTTINPGAQNFWVTPQDPTNFWPTSKAYNLRGVDFTYLELLREILGGHGVKTAACWHRMLHSRGGPNICQRSSSNDGPICTVRVDDVRTSAYALSESINFIASTVYQRVTKCGQGSRVIFPSFDPAVAKQQPYIFHERTGMVIRSDDRGTIEFSYRIAMPLDPLDWDTPKQMAMTQQVEYIRA